MQKYKLQPQQMIEKETKMQETRKTNSLEVKIIFGANFCGNVG